MIEEEIDLYIQEGRSRFPIICQGQSLEPRLDIQPKTVRFRPLKPNEDGDVQTVFVKNPCNFPVELYSMDFDHVHIQVCLKGEFPWLA